MDAATAAIVASAITGSVALGGALLAPHLAAKRARETKLLEMRYDAYVEALQLASSVMLKRDPKHLEAVAHKMLPMFAHLRLLGNDDVAHLYFMLHNKVSELARKLRGADEDTSSTVGELGELTKLFTDTMRAHLGVGDVER